MQFVIPQLTLASCILSKNDLGEFHFSDLAENKKDDLDELRKVQIWQKIIIRRSESE